MGCDDVVDPAVQDCDDEPVPDGEVTVELCCADPRVEENHIQVVSAAPAANIESAAAFTIRAGSQPAVASA